MEKKFGNFKLPGGEASWAYLVKIFECLDIKSVFNLIKSYLIKHLKLVDESKYYIANILYKLIERYRIEFPRSCWKYGCRNEIPTPFVCACEHGRMDDVELFMNLHPFHKYITNRDVNGYRDDMTLKEMVSQIGRNSNCDEWTPLMTAAMNDHFQVVKYLIEQGEADPNITDSEGWNVLHYAARFNRTNTDLIELLLTNMPLASINKKITQLFGGDTVGSTPLDCAYHNKYSPIQQEIIALIRSKGGKANDFDLNGNYVGRGNGDLNH